MRGPAALGSGSELVAEPDVRERAAHHHFVVAATRAVGVEVRRLHALLDEVTCRRAESTGIEPAGEIWSVVTESPSIASTRMPPMILRSGLLGSTIASKYGGRLI